MTPTNAEVKLVDQQGADAIFVSLRRVHPCYSEMADVSWSGNNKSRKKTKKQFVTTTTNHTSGSVTRSMTTHAREWQEQPFQGQLSISEAGIVIFGVKTICRVSNYLCLRI